MNKTKLIKKTSIDFDITQVQIKKILDVFINTITEELKNGNDISLVSFGTFQTKMKNSREGRNPKTGKIINIPEKRIVKFIASKELKESVKL